MPANETRNIQEQQRSKKFSLRRLLFFITLLAIAAAALRSPDPGATELIAFAVALIYVAADLFVDAEYPTLFGTLIRRLRAAISGIVDGAIIGVVVVILVSNISGILIPYGAAAAVGAITGMTLGACFPYVLERYGFPLY